MKRELLVTNLATWLAAERVDRNPLNVPWRNLGQKQRDELSDAERTSARAVLTWIDALPPDALSNDDK